MIVTIACIALALLTFFLGYSLGKVDGRNELADEIAERECAMAHLGGRYAGEAE